MMFRMTTTMGYTLRFHFLFGGSATGLYFFPTKESASNQLAVLTYNLIEKGMPFQGEAVEAITVEPV